MSEGTATSNPSDQPEPRHHLSVAPDDRRCVQMIVKKGVATQCTRYDMYGPDGTTDRYCLNHSPSAHAVEARSKRLQAQRAKFDEEAANRRRTTERLIPDRFTSLQDIADARQRVILALDADEVSSSKSKSLHEGLDRQAEHMREFGEPQRLEGGRGYVRAVAGVRIVESFDDTNRPLTCEEFRLLHVRQELDRRAGVEPPASWAEAIAKYLGMPREPEVVYDPSSLEPIGEKIVRAWRDPKTGRRVVKTYFRKYESLEHLRRLIEAGEGPCPCCKRRRVVPPDLG